MKNINDLLEKYWEGETTLEEEKLLRNQWDAIDGSDASFFKALREESQVSSNLDQDAFLKLINGNDQIKEKSKRVFSLRPLLKYAAILMLPLALVFSLKFFNMMENDGLGLASTQDHIIEIDDPEEALRLTKEALMLVSNKINKGQNEVLKHLPHLKKTNILN